MSKQRIVKLLHNDNGLQQHDLDHLIAIGRLSGERAAGLLGARLADLRNRLYAQAALPAQDAHPAPSAPLSAPFASWAIGVLLAAEHEHGLTPVHRRVEVELHGYRADFVQTRAADATGRCVCNSAVRRRWTASLYRGAAA